MKKEIVYYHKWIWGLVCASTLLLALTAESAHLSKDFVSAGREAARSMEPNHSHDVASSESGSQTTLGGDLNSVLCGRFKEWSDWSVCSKKCEQARVRRCANPEECGKTWVKEKRTCIRERGSCSPLSYKNVYVESLKKIIGIQKRNRMIEEILYDLLYHQWSQWGPCTRSCRQRRQRKCKYKPVCELAYIQEERRCKVKDSSCEHRFSLKPDVTSMEPSINASIDLGDGEGDGSDGENNSRKCISAKQTAIFTITDGKPKEDEDDDDDISEKEEILLEENNAKETDEEEKNGADGHVDVLTLPVWSEKTEKDKGRSGSKSSRRKDRTTPPTNGDNIGLPRKCGIRPKQMTGSYRVVGGQEVRKNSWPWQVAIMTKYKEQYCGGTLIAPRWVLTAAHCVRKHGKRRRLIVRVGEHDTVGYDLTQGKIRPEKEFPHPDFDYHTITNDIALIKLRHEPSSYSRPGYACLPAPDYVPPRRPLCTIVGWGKIKSSNLYGSDALHEAQVPVVKHRKCQRVFDYPIRKNQVCAGYKRGGIDSCAGDSGGPLLCKDGPSRYVLYGVTSYGEGCGLKGKYGIYSKVSSYLPWIYKTIRENS